MPTTVNISNPCRMAIHMFYMTLGQSVGFIHLTILQYRDSALSKSDFFYYKPQVFLACIHSHRDWPYSCNCSHQSILIITCNVHESSVCGPNSGPLKVTHTILKGRVYKVVLFVRKMIQFRRHTLVFLPEVELRLLHHM